MAEKRSRARVDCRAASLVQRACCGAAPTKSIESRARHARESQCELIRRDLGCLVPADGMQGESRWRLRRRGSHDGRWRSDADTEKRERQCLE